MDMKLPDRAAAWAMLGESVKGESLLRHCVTVEAVMRHFAGLYGEDPEVWGAIGLLHDIDFERYPEQHCKKVRDIAGDSLPEFALRAIESHGYGIVNDVEPLTNLEKTLFTVDELTGLIAAAALLRPSRSLSDLEVKSVKKKWKQKGFAANVNREVIEKGASMLGMELDEVIGQTIEGMRTVAAVIGLAGDAE